MNVRLVILLVLFGMQGLVAQEASRAQVAELFELTGSRESYEQVIKTMVEFHKEQHYSADVDSTLWSEFEKVVMKKGLDSLYADLIPIYQNHFSEKEMTTIIRFYKSDVGRKYFEKMTTIGDELVDISTKWGRNLVEDIVADLMASEELNKYALHNHCSQMKAGRFESLSEASDSQLIIERKDGFHIETAGEHRNTYKIKWNTFCRYELTLVESTDSSLQDKLLSKPILCWIVSVENEKIHVKSQIEGSDSYVENVYRKIQ